MKWHMLVLLLLLVPPHNLLAEEQDYELIWLPAPKGVAVWEDPETKEKWLSLAPGKQMEFSLAGAGASYWNFVIKDGTFHFLYCIGDYKSDLNSSQLKHDPPYLDPEFIGKEGLAGINPIMSFANKSKKHYLRVKMGYYRLVAAK